MKKFATIFFILLFTLQLNAQKIVKTYWDSYTRKKLQKQYTTTNDGFLNGLYKEWYSDGTPQRTVMYKLDKKDGSYKEWWPNGNMKVNGTFVSDVRQGWFSWYTERGALSNQKLYTDGVVREEKEMFNIPGTPLSKSTWYDENHRSISFKTYRENGKLIQESVAPLENGKYGWSIVYFRNGKRRTTYDINLYWENVNIKYYDKDGVTEMDGPVDDQ